MRTLALSPLLLAAAITLAGCASTGGLHTDGTPTDTAALHGERSFAKIQTTPAAWPASDWWTKLGDVQLDALITEALKNNPDLASADARAKEAQSQVAAQNAKRLPTVNAAGSVAGVYLPTTAVPAPIGGSFGTYPAVYASFSWSLDLWGGKRAAWEAALGQARAAEVDAHAARLTLSVNVARAYVQLGYAFAEKDVTDAQLKRANASHALVKQRVAAGIDNRLQIKQAETEVASAEQQAAVADEAIDAARIALAVLLGKGPDRGLDIARPQALQAAALALPPNLTADLIGRRADLVAARWRVEAATKSIAAVKTEFLPNIGLSAFAGLTSSSFDNLLSLPARFALVQPAISLPIFDGGRRRSDLNNADAGYDLAVAHYNSTLVGAINDVADKLANLGSLQTQIAAQQRAVDAARGAYELSQQRYKAGIGSYLDTLSVQQQLLTAEQRAAALAAQQVDTSVRLVQALGGGFDAGGDVPPVAAATP
ncbi:efflux transporter outer membrane subunit [Rudaea cellulosilytica]|uniref:efflux transporter outer membrane subunit n=1 Tax=Rudaea cellulosilytica TaxID=540746 RepID=UPI0003A7E2AD|nr:efflux transporter outer membrane subunit [Rudaea cellulosilytica]